MNLDRFVGIPYCEDTFDCADFVALVQREMYGREVNLPNGRERGERGYAVVAGRVEQYATPTDVPADGDLVLMGRKGRKGGHVGLYFHLDHEGYVLHSNETDGCSVLHRARDLPDFGTTIKGYYEWA